MVKKNAIISTKDCWSLSRLPAPWNTLVPKKDYEGVLLNEFHNSSFKQATLLSYVVEAVIADAANEMLGGEPCLIEFTASDASESWYGAEAANRMDPSGDKGKLIASCKNQGGVVSLYCSYYKEKIGTAATTAIPTDNKKEAPYDLLPLYMCIIACMRKTFPSIDDEFVLARQAIQQGSNASDREVMSLYRLSDMVYYAISEEKFKVNISGGSVPTITNTSLKGGMFIGGKVLYGKSTVFTDSTVTVTSKATTFGEAKKQFASFAATRTWSPEEESLIPTFPDDYPVMDEAVKIARRYINSRADRRPMVNFMWRGITSYGKSTGVEMLAAFLHTPLLRMTCSSTMETQDFLSNFVPDNGTSVVEAVPEVSVEEMFCDPVSAYKRITGKENPAATDQDCLNAMMEIAAANASQGQARFKHVESNFVKAMSRGYICEIQEASRIKDAGVLVGLNEFDRPGSIIPLTNGGYTTRHPDAMCVYTDNVGYASCRPLDPSVIRRFSFIIDSFTMKDAQILNRVVYNTGFKDKTLLRKMLTVWKTLQNYCKEHEIDEGSVSVTELEMWAACVKADGYENVYNNAIDCVISKATSVADEQKELIDSVLSTTFKAGQ